MKQLILILILFTSTTLCSMAQIYKNSSDIALNGYDVVAYHQLHEAQRGTATFSTEHQGAVFYFASEANLKMFKEKPTQYLPQFGGHCAFAMAMKGQMVPSDPTTFKFHDGKLYLFYNDYFEGNPFNTLIPWAQDEAQLLPKAHANWRKQ